MTKCLLWRISNFNFIPTGKENGYSENLRDWFKLIYEVVFGDRKWPSNGFFYKFFWC